MSIKSLRRWQYSSEGLCHARLKRVREHNVELDDKSSFLEWIPILWHSLPLHLFQVASFDHLAWEKKNIEQEK